MTEINKKFLVVEDEKDIDKDPFTKKQSRQLK